MKNLDDGPDGLNRDLPRVPHTKKQPIPVVKVPERKARK